MLSYCTIISWWNFVPLPRCNYLFDRHLIDPEPEFIAICAASKNGLARVIHSRIRLSQDFNTHTRGLCLGPFLSQTPTNAIVAAIASTAFIAVITSSMYCMHHIHPLYQICFNFVISILYATAFSWLPWRAQHGL